MIKKTIFVLLAVFLSVSSGLWAGGSRDSEKDPPDIGIETPRNTPAQPDSLLEMAKSGDESGLERLLKVDVNLDETDSSGQTALHIAAAEGHENIAAFLLLQGAKVNLKDNNGRTPLLLATEAGHSKLMALLVKEGGDIGIKDSQGRSPASIALRASPDRLTPLLRESNVNRMVLDSGSMLHAAASGGLLEHVRVLLANGADPSLRNDKGQTALDVALSGNVGLQKARIAAELVKAGAPLPRDERWQYISKVFRSDDIDRRFDYGSTALHLATERGQEGMVQLLLERGAGVDARDQPGNTALHVAVRRGYKRLAEILLDAGANVNAQDYNGNAPIHEALASVESPALITLLLNRGADPNIKNGSGSTALHLTVLLQSSPEIAQLLLDRGAFIDPRDRNGNTALLLAAQENAENLAKLFLNNGAAVFARNNTGLTPAEVALRSGANTVSWFFTGYRLVESDNEGRSALHLAVKLDVGPDVLDVLLNAGTEPNQRDAQGATALHYAVSENHLEQAGILLKNGADIYLEDNSGTSPIILAFDKGGSFTTQLLATHIDVQDSEKSTPLFHAVRWDYPLVAEALLKSGADVNHQNIHGHSALHEAVRADSVAAVTLLARFGINPNLADELGKTALHDAVSWGVLDMAKLLVDSGANPDARDLEGQTSLHLAAFAGNIEISRWLLANGAAPDVRDNDSRTPLFVTAEADRVLVARLLVDKGASVRLRDVDGNTPLHVAVRRSNTAVAKFLLGRGADFFAVNAMGETPLTLALKGGPRFLKALLDEELVNRQDNAGNTPLHIAVASGSDISVLQALLDIGADRSSRNARGLSPSQLAASLGFSEKAALIR